MSSLMWKDTLTTAILIRKTFNWGGSQGWGSVHYHRGEEHGGMQAGRCWSWESYIFIDSQQEVEWLSHWGKLEQETSKPAPQWHTSSKQGHTSLPLLWGPLSFKPPQVQQISFLLLIISKRITFNLLFLEWSTEKWGRLYSKYCSWHLYSI